MKSSAHTIFVITTTLSHAPTLYWNYVLSYEISHSDHFCCHDIEPPPNPQPSQMKSSAHAIFAMTMTLPHAPTLYWNYLLGYEIRPTDHFWHWPHPSTHFVLCIMYYFVRSHHLYHENDPTPLPHLVLELCIILWKWTTNIPLSPHPCQVPFNLYWNYVLCLFSNIMLLNWP